jgi:hypothetical protein
MTTFARTPFERPAAHRWRRGAAVLEPCLSFFLPVFAFAPDVQSPRGPELLFGYIPSLQGSEFQIHLRSHQGRLLSAFSSPGIIRATGRSKTLRPARPSTASVERKESHHLSKIPSGRNNPAQAAARIRGQAIQRRDPKARDAAS